MRNRGQVQTGVGRATGASHHAGGVLQAFQGHDVTRADVLVDQVHDGTTRGLAIHVAAVIGRGHARAVDQRQADCLGHTGHGVGRELTATGSRRRARDALHDVQLGLGQVASLVFTNGFEQVLNGNVFAFVATRQDRSAIDEDGRRVQTHHDHHHARQGFVTPGQTNDGVIAVAAHGQFHTVRNRFARGKRAAHALVTHGDTVGDGDGGEFARRTGGGLDAQLDGLGLTVQRDVARRGFVPAGRDTNQRLVNFFLAQPHGVQVRPVRRARGAFGHVSAGQVGFEVASHLGLPGKKLFQIGIKDRPGTGKRGFKRQRGLRGGSRCLSCTK